MIKVLAILIEVSHLKIDVRIVYSIKILLNCENLAPKRRQYDTNVRVS